MGHPPKALGVNTPIEMEGLFFTFLGAGENRLYERTPNVQPVAAVLELLPTNRDLIASGQGVKVDPVHLHLL